AEGLAGDLERTEDEAEEGAEAGEEHGGTGGLRGRGVERAAPEVIPAGDDHRGGDEVGPVAEELKRQLAEKGADASGEVCRRAMPAAAEEPHRVARLVAGERNNPDQRRREQRTPDELTDAARSRRSTQVRSP